MKRIFNVLVITVLLGNLLISCTGNTENKNDETVNNSTQPAEISNQETDQASQSEHPGKAVYTKYCLVCHQSDGSGVPGMHPPLGPGSWVGNDPKELIAMMMKGLSGKIEVNGEIYNGFMPSQAQLTDEEIADVLTYIRSNFGNNFEAVDAALVRKVRSGK